MKKIQNLANYTKFEKSVYDANLALQKKVNITNRNNNRPHNLDTFPSNYKHRTKYL